MKKLRTMMLGLALAVSFASVSANAEVANLGHVESAPQTQDGTWRCCWYFFMGSWYCYVC